VLVCGGYTGIITPTTELYDPSTGVWAGARSLAAAREFHTATLLPNGLVMISGGLGATAASLNSVEIYDPANAFMVYGGSWTSNPGSLTTSRMFHAATLMNNGEVLITGGESGTSFLPMPNCFIKATKIIDANLRTIKMNITLSRLIFSVLPLLLLLLTACMNGAVVQLQLLIQTRVTLFLTLRQPLPQKMPRRRILPLARL